MQIQPPSGFSASLELDGLPVLVCGGGPAALSAIRQLLDAGAVLTVVASEIGATVADLAARGLLIMRRRPPAPDDFLGAALVVPATGLPERDQMIAAAAREHGVPAVSPSPATIEQSAGTGSVILVGGGPGDPGLLTVAGLEAIKEADVIVCDRLAPLSALQYARPEAVIIEVAKIPRGAYTSQERINEILVDHASAGKTVVRLKGGDPFVFGRGGEEWQACAAAGIPVKVIPGVTSATAAPALAGVPLTHRELTQGFTVISGHAPPGDPGSTLNWQALATANTTLVIMMGVATLPAIAAELIKHGLAADTPAMTVADAAMPSQQSVRGTLADIAALTTEADIKPPAITVIGAVAGFAPTASHVDQPQHYDGRPVSPTAGARGRTKWGPGLLASDEGGEFGGLPVGVQINRAADQLKLRVPCPLPVNGWKYSRKPDFATSPTRSSSSRRASS
jgi:uroporphyrin-III C-methyltransferase